MKASDALQSNRQTLATCIPEESIVSLATRLNTLNIGAMPVTDATGALVESSPSATSCAPSPRTGQGSSSGAFAI